MVERPVQFGAPDETLRGKSASVIIPWMGENTLGAENPAKIGDPLPEFGETADAPGATMR